MFWEAMGAARDLGRLHDIASVLIRYGMGDLVRRLGLSRVLERAGHALHWQDPEAMAHMAPPQRLRRALEDLGPTFIKLGQILSTRVDLLPPEYLDALEGLVDDVPAVPFEDIREQLEADLGAPPEEVFQWLDTEPLASASIAQVHRARTQDGREVILKIRRPGIEETVEADLRLLSRLADLAESELAEARRYRPREVVRQFSRSLKRELDFAREARNADRVRENFRREEELVIPVVHWEWTGERLNVQDFVDGIPGRDLAAVDEAGLDRRLLARRGAHAVLHMTLVDGFFHADPHGGNVFFLPDNRLALIDFGMMGSLSEERRQQVGDLLMALVNRDTEATVDTLLEWTAGPPSDPERLAVEVDAFLDTYHGLPLRELHFAEMVTDLMSLIREHELTLPPDLSLLFKSFLSLDGLGRRLDDSFDIVGEARPFLRRLMSRRYRPETVWRNARNRLGATMDLLNGLPRDLRRLMRLARRGALQVNVDLTRLIQFGHQMDRAASRLAVGLVTAALIISTAIVVAFLEDGPTFLGLPVFTTLGLGGAVAGMFWLALSIRHGSHRD
ncbi:MAG: ABC1 kinase family protein [Thiohalospira sp.]